MSCRALPTSCAQFVAPLASTAVPVALSWLRVVNYLVLHTPQMSDEAPETDYGAVGDVGGDVGGEDFDADLAALEAMQAEAENENSLIQETVSSAMASATEFAADKEVKDREKAIRDERSVFVSNVHWESTGPEVAAYFSSCGPVEKVMILQDKFGQAKG